MRKRILAICLSAALLLGLLPVLSAPSSAAEENATVTEFDLSTTQSFNVGTSNFNSNSGDAYGRAQLAANQGVSAWVSSTLELDHSKDILFEQKIQVQETGLPAIDATAALTPSNGVNAHEGYQIVLSTGSEAFCAVLFYAESGLQLCVATQSGTEIVELGAKKGTFGDAAFDLSILWSADDSATVSVNGIKVGTVKNAVTTIYTGIGEGSRLRLRLYSSTQQAVILFTSLKITQAAPGVVEDTTETVFDLVSANPFNDSARGFTVAGSDAYGRASFDSTTSSSAFVSHLMEFDHSKNILFEQKIQVQDGGLPGIDASSALTPSDGVNAHEGYQIVLSTGTTAFCADLFNTAEGLKLCVATAAGTEVVDLGASTGTYGAAAFTLAILWGADDSATISVNGSEKAKVTNASSATYTGIGAGSRMRLRLNSTTASAKVLTSSLKITQSVPATSEEPEWTVSQQAVLGEDIALDLHIAMPEGLNAEDYKVLVGVGESTTEQPLSDLPVKDGKYVATASMAAAQMNDTVTLKITDAGGEEMFANTYIVRGYALDIINGTYGEYDETTIALVQAMLDYGGKAQAYFNYNASNPANDGISVINQEIPSADAYATQVNGSLEGIQVKGVTLLFQSETVIRYYFTACEGFTFTVDGKEYTEVKKNATGYYVDVTVDNPSLMAELYTVCVTDGAGNEMSVSYSCLHYIVRMYHKDTTSQTLKDLLQAMYNYYMAAKDYPG